MARTMSLAGLVVGGLILLAGLAIFVDTWDQTRWQKTQGTVVASEVVVKAERSTGETGSRAYWTLVVRYRYSAGGQAHVGDRYSSRPPRARADGDTPPAELVQLAAKYPPGAAVEVYFNPARPQEAFLEPFRSPSWVVLAIGIVISAVALGFWLRGR